MNEPGQDTSNSQVDGRARLRNIVTAVASFTLVVGIVLAFWLPYANPTAAHYLLGCIFGAWAIVVGSITLGVALQIGRVFDLRIADAPRDFIFGTKTFLKIGVGVPAALTAIVGIIVATIALTTNVESGTKSTALIVGAWAVVSGGSLAVRWVQTRVAIRPVGSISKHSDNVSDYLSEDSANTSTLRFVEGFTIAAITLALGIAMLLLPADTNQTRGFLSAYFVILSVYMLIVVFSPRREPSDFSQKR